MLKNITDNLILDPEYSIELVASGLTFPTSIAFDSHNRIYIGESGFSYGPAKVEGGGKIKRIDPPGNTAIIVSGFEGPLTGLSIHEDSFYVITGSHKGKIYRIDKNGNYSILVDGLPTGGDHYTSNLVFHSGKMYFGAGTFTNSAVVGMDNFFMGWLASHPDWHDIPPRDYELRGVNYTSLNPFKLDQPEMVVTAAFHPFGVPSEPGEVVKGEFWANGVIYCSNLDGSEVEHYATGLRNPFALGFSPREELICIDQGYDLRGSRPIANAPDLIWRIRRGGWYGFPDFIAELPVSDRRFKPPEGDPPELVLAEHPPVSGELAAFIEPHAAAMQFDFSKSSKFGYAGEAFVSLFGSLAPMTGTVKDHPGHRVVRLDMETGRYYDFLKYKHDGEHAPIRPIDVKFSPNGDSLYVLDFGRIDVNKAEMTPYAESGALFKIMRK